MFEIYLIVLSHPTLAEKEYYMYKRDLNTVRRKLKMEWVSDDLLQQSIRRAEALDVIFEALD